MKKVSYILIERAFDEESAPKIFLVGVNKVFSPYTIGGIINAHVLVKPNITEFMDVFIWKNNFNIEVGEIALTRFSKLVGKKLCSQI